MKVRISKVLCLILVCVFAYVCMLEAAENIITKNSITVTCEKMARPTSEKYKNYIGVSYFIESLKNIDINIDDDKLPLFDKHGNKFDYDTSYVEFDNNMRLMPLISIRNQRTLRRTIAAGVKTPVVVFYKVGASYEPDDYYPSATLTLNKIEYVFTNIPGTAFKK